MFLKTPSPDLVSDLPSLLTLIALLKRPADVGSELILIHGRFPTSGPVYGIHRYSYTPRP